MTNEGDIRAWLAEHGFAKYADAFVSNAIGLDVLPELNDADLKDIGITALGDRKRLLRAIASLAAAIVSSVVPTTTAPSLKRNADRSQCCSVIWLARWHSQAVLTLKTFEMSFAPVTNAARRSLAGSMARSLSIWAMVIAESNSFFKTLQGVVSFDENGDIADRTVSVSSSVS
jgi:hypothetical protein